MKPTFEIVTGDPPNPCCVPSRKRAELWSASLASSAQLARTRTGSIEGMVRLDGGSFLMGTENAEGFAKDGEGPVREVHVDAFFIDDRPVTNQQFGEFVRATGYITEAERCNWSFVFQNQIAPERYPELVEGTVLGAPWWCKVRRAAWNRPEGPDSNIGNRSDYPVVHVSWNDAASYASWTGKRLPTEAEWEFSARGGLEQKRFPWGDELTPDGRHLCNIWQGEFPKLDLAEDGYAAPAPVDAYPPNAFGLYTITGNVWEWCRDWFHPSFHVVGTRTNPAGPLDGSARVMKGGSFLCHESYCNRYRVAARTSNSADSSTTNIGFRCVRDV